MHNLKVSSIDNIKHATIGSTLSNAFRILFLLLAARILGPKDFGLFAIINVVFLLAHAILVRGIPQPIIQQEKISSKQISALLWANIIASLAITLLCWLFAPVLAHMLDATNLISLFQASTILLFLEACTGIPLALFKRNLHFNVIARINISSSFVGIAIGLLLLLNGYGLWSLIVFRIAIGVSRLLWTVFLGSWKSIKLQRPSIEKVQRYGILVAGHNLTMISELKGPELVIGFIFGAEILGFWNIGMQLLQLFMQVFVQPIFEVAQSTIAKLQNDLQRQKRVLLSFIRLVTAYSFGPLLFLSLFAKEIVTTLLGQEWSAAGEILPWLMFLSFLLPVRLILFAFLQAIGKRTFSFLVILCNSIALIVLLLLFTHISLVAAAIAFIIVHFLTFGVVLSYCLTIVHTDHLVFLKHTYAQIASSLITVLSVILLRNQLSVTITFQQIHELVLASLVIILMYAVGIRFISPPLFKEMLSTMSTLFSLRREK